MIPFSFPANTLEQLSNLKTFCAVGDSITDRNTIYQASILGNNTDISGWGAILETLSGHRIKSTQRNNAFKVDRDHGYSGINALAYLLGEAAGPGYTWLNGVIPVDDAINSNPDCFIVHIGTNDSDTSAQTAASRIINLWKKLVKTGKPVIGTTILQRTATYPGWTEARKNWVNDVNTILKASWRNVGLKILLDWDGLLQKDSNGYAVNDEFPSDGLHPTSRGGVKYGKNTFNYLKNSIAGPNPYIPNYGSIEWLTPNPALLSGTNIAVNWNTQGFSTGDSTSKYTDNGEIWQRINIVQTGLGFRGIWTRQVGSGITWNVGDRCCVVGKVRCQVAGFNMQSVTLEGYCAPNANNTQLVNQHALGSTHEPFDGLYYSDPFTIPSGTTELWTRLYFYGSGTIDFTQCGVFKV